MATFAGGFNSEKHVNQIAKAQFAEVTLIAIKELTSKNNNQYLFGDFQIEEGDDRGKHAFININHAHFTESVRNIALRTLGQMAIALGKPVFEDTAELHGLSCIARILIEPDMNGADRNVLAGFYSKEKFAEMKAAGKLPSLEKAASTKSAAPANVPDFSANAPATPAVSPATSAPADSAVPSWLKTPATAGSPTAPDSDIPF